MLYYSANTLLGAFNSCLGLQNYTVFIATKNYIKIADEVFYTATSLDDNNILQKRCSYYQHRIMFKNGSRLYVMRAGEQVRGYKYNLLIVEEGIEEEIINMRLRPMEIPYRVE